MEENTLKLENMVPGDKATFNIVIENKSTVLSKYRTVIKCLNDDGLFAGLNVTIGGDEYDDKNKTVESDWEMLAVGSEDITVEVVIELPADAGNDYKKTSCTLAYTVEATQGNTQVRDYGMKWSGNAASLTRTASVAANVKTLEDVTDTVAKTVKIETPELLAAFAQSVNSGNDYYGYTVTLEADMDLCDIDWTPIGTEEHPFRCRVFDGQGYTISNLQCNGGVAGHTDLEATNQGLIGVTHAQYAVVEIKNLTICNVNIYAKNSAGAVIGSLDSIQSGFVQEYTGVHDIKLIGKVTIEGGSAGGIAGSPTSRWATGVGFSDIIIDVEEGSYVSNIMARELSGEGVSGTIGSVAAILAYSNGGVHDIKSNLDVIGSVSGDVGGIVGVGNYNYWDITYTGNVTVKNVAAKENGIYKGIGLIIGELAPLYGKKDPAKSISATGTLTIELTDGTTIHSNGQESNNFGGWAW